MLRIATIAVLILAAAVLLCVLALRVLLSTAFALSGIPRRAHGAEALDW